MPHNPANVDRFSGFAQTYDTARPTPPSAIVDLLTQLIETPTPNLVVDLGSGTGLSTRPWLNRAKNIIGIEPNQDMRAKAQSYSPHASLSYINATAEHTTLPDNSADLVTISQALHWMDPTPTFTEVARILRPGGLLAAYDCDWPPLITADITAAYLIYDQRSRQIERERVRSPVKHLPKHEHLARMQSSGLFRHTFESALHNIEPGDSARLLNLALSQGDTQTCLRAGLTPDQIGLTELQSTLAPLFQNRTLPWYVTYRLRLAVK